jgi:hypothetical protein
MKVLFVIIALFALSATSFSQTKRIAHRSHSGKNSTFTIKSIHNFGERHARQDLEKIKIDTVKKPVVDTVKKQTIVPVKKPKAKKANKPVAKTTH